MSSVYFPFRPRPNDLRAAMVVQRNLDYLADKLKELQNRSDSGSSAIPQGATSVGVIFRLSILNPIVVVTPVGDPGQGLWVTGKNSLGFTVNLASPAKVGGVPFDWIARGSGS